MEAPLTGLPLNALRRPRPGGATAPAREATDFTLERIGGLLLSVLLVVVYGQTVTFPFVSWDDVMYVVRNARIAGGLTPANIAWAFTTFDCFNWHPATWLSHLLDGSLYGDWAGGHHLTSVLLHGINAVLVWAVLLRMSGRRFESVCAALVFAIHPQRVESVAWVSERKDVLCGTGVLLAVWAYLKYADAGTCTSASRFRWYAGVLGGAALACLAKPMAVTLPCVLLLLDAWPLGRIRWLAGRSGPAAQASLVQLVGEKLPLIAMAVLTSLLTLSAQREPMRGMAEVPLAERFANAMAAYVGYLQHAIWPTHLAAFYPFGGHRLTALEVGLIATALGLVTVVVTAVFSRAGWLAVGWLWFLGMLVPVIGVVQVGSQGMADRYYYLPGVGLEMAFILGVGGLVRRAGAWLQMHRPPHVVAQGRRLGMVVLAAFVCLFAAHAFLQVGTWSSSEMLWRHAVMVVPDNYVAFSQLGTELDRQGRTDEAIAAYEASLALKPDFYDALSNFGMLLSNEGCSERALPMLREAAKFRPDDIDTIIRLAICLTRLGRAPEAETAYARALALKPDSALAVVNYAMFLADSGRLAEARRMLDERRGAEPDDGTIAEAVERLAARVKHETEEP